MKEEHLEVKRHHGPTALERLRWHLGTIVAILLAALLVLQAFGLVLKPSTSATAALEGLTESCNRVQKSVENRMFPVEERLKEVEAHVGDLRKSLKHLGTGAQAPESLTYPADYLETLKPGASNEIRFQAPINVVATADAGGIDLKWAEGANNNVKVGAFEILRQEDAGEAAPVTKVEGSVYAWRDTSAKPGHAYEYTVVALAADVAIANTPRGRSPASAPATAKALTDFKIELLGAKDGTATFHVSKFREGSWRDRTFDAREGEPIGGMDDALAIDFSTGRRLVKLTIETIDVPVTRDEVVFDPKGRVVVEAGAPKRVSVSSTEPRQRITAAVSGGGLPDDTIVLEK
jgi:hypothetical protein